MKRLFSSLIVAGAIALAMPAAPASAAKTRPKNATAQCKDGTYSTAKTKQGACSNHGGVDAWLADAKPEPKSAPAPVAKSEAPVAKSESKIERKVSRDKTQTKIETKSETKAGDPTAQCNDGTYSYAVHHQGACSGHQGVKSWFK